jgi:nucleoside-diphosphate-sugar epimerase
MKIVITGATGSLGAHLVRYFSKAGHEVLASGRSKNPPSRLHDFASYLPIDIETPFELPPADVIIHCAALADDNAGADALYAANVAGTRNVCDAAKHIPVFVHVSSSSVYPILNKPLTEDLSALGNDKNLSPYGISKLLAEGVVQEFCQSKSAFILRPRGIYGPGDKVLFPRVLQMMRNGKMVAPGKMNVQTSMTHFDNFAHAIECCLNSGKEGKHAYNVSDADTMKLFDSLKMIQDGVHKQNVPVKHVPLPIIRLLSVFGAKGITPLFVRTISSNVVLDISKIKQEVGYSPTKTFRGSLPEITAWVESIGGSKVLKQGHNSLAWA